MREDAITELTAEVLIRASLEIDNQLTPNAATQPVAVMLEMARQEAAAAMLPLVKCDPTDATKVRELQAVILRYHDMVRWLSDIVTKGVWLKTQIEAAQRENLIKVLNPSEDLEYSGGEEFDDGDAEQG